MTKPIHTVTTMNADGWQGYGERFARSYKRHWPSDIRLLMYPEGFAAPEWAESCELPEWQAEFKDRHKNNPDAHGEGCRKPFKRQAVRFSHKVGAICDAYERIGNNGWMIWLDADTYTHSPVTHEWLESLAQDKFMIALLQRQKNHSECGFFIVNLEHISAGFFFKRLRQLYETDELFKYPETHDSYLIDMVLAEMHGQYKLSHDHIVNLSGPNNDRGHVFVRSRLAECMDHRKGMLKSKKHTFISSVAPQYRAKFRGIRD